MISTQVDESGVKQSSFIQAFCTVAAIIIVISGGVFFLKTSPHIILLMCIMIAASSAWLLGYNFHKIRQAMNSGINNALSAVYICILIGVLIAAFIQSGTLATLIYYGIEFTNPVIFLPAGMILCSLMSIATGTSWGTVGTAGVVLMGIGQTINIPAPLVAGMIISGACFGDNISPVSDTTNLAAMSSKTNLYHHIQSLLFTTFPSYLIALAIFTMAGMNYAGHQLNVAELHSLQKAIDDRFSIHILTIIPIIIMFVLSLRKISPEPTMVAAITAAVFIAVFLQERNFIDIIDSLYDGSSVKTGHESVDGIMSRGGIASMMWTLSLSLMALALGGILDSCQFLRRLITVALTRIKRSAALVATTIISCFVGNMIMGEAYITIILGGQLFGKAYDQMNVKRSVLSRSLEEGSALTTALIPWTTAGVFFSSALGVSVLDYAPWALLNWLGPIISILFAYLGIALFKVDAPLKAQPVAI